MSRATYLKKIKKINSIATKGKSKTQINELPKTKNQTNEVVKANTETNKATESKAKSLKVKEQTNISQARRQYLKKIRIEKISVIATQIIIVVIFIAMWEILANNGIIDSFIMSSPSRIINTFLNLAQNDLIKHLLVTCTETIIGFLLGTTLGAIIAIILWWSKFISKVSEPFLVVLNSLPKIALRASNNNMGRSRNACNNSNGTCNFINSNYIRNFKWIYKHRQGINKNGKNIWCK